MQVTLCQNDKVAIEELHPLGLLVRRSVGHFFDRWLVWEGQTCAGWCHRGQVVLHYLRKQAEQTIERKQVSQQRSPVVATSVPA